MGSLWSDLKATMRSLAAQPMFALIALVTIGLLICGVTLILSLIQGVLLDPGPYREPDRLVTLRLDGQQAAGRQLRYDDYRTLKAALDETDSVMEALVATTGGAAGYFMMTGAGDALRLRGARVTGETFPMLGVPALVGRGLQPEDDRPGADPVVVLHEDIWRTYFGADRAAIGRTVILDGRPHIIVGVMPSAFRWIGLDAWTPMRPDLYFPTPSTHYVIVSGRLRAGVSDQQARTRLTNIVQGIAARQPARFPPHATVRLESQRDLRGGRADAPAMLLTLLSGVVMLTMARQVSRTSSRSCTQ